MLVGSRCHKRLALVISGEIIFRISHVRLLKLWRSVDLSSNDVKSMVVIFHAKILKNHSPNRQTNRSKHRDLSIMTYPLRCGQLCTSVINYIAKLQRIKGLNQKFDNMICGPSPLQCARSSAKLALARIKLDNKASRDAAAVGGTAHVGEHEK
jgi:hypothetical protein